MRRRRTAASRVLASLLLLGAIGIGVRYAVAGGRGRPRPAPALPAKTRGVSAHGGRRHTESSLLRLPAVLPSRTADVPVLMYHRIDRLTSVLAPITRALTVSPPRFADEMEWLRDHGFHAISQLQLFDALEHGAALPPKPVLITFDDGYRDVLWNAAPVLARLHMRATAYVITGRLSGPDTSFLTWPELRRLEGFGVEIGSHTVHHRELTMLSDAEAAFELAASRQALERHLGHPVQWFAYPEGAEDAHAASLVAAAGYVLAVTTQGGRLQRADEPLALHRYEIQGTTTVGELAALVGG